MAKLKLLKAGDYIYLKKSKDLPYRSYFQVVRASMMTVEHRRCTTNVPATYIYQSPVNSVILCKTVSVEIQNYILEQLERNAQCIIDENPFYLELKCTSQSIPLLSNTKYEGIHMYDRNGLHQVFEILGTPKVLTNKRIEIILGRKFHQYVKKPKADTWPLFQSERSSIENP